MELQYKPISPSSIECGGSIMTQKEKQKKRTSAWYQKRRLAVLMIVGRKKLYCRRCKNSNVKHLEINHKNGGGTQEVGNYRMRFYASILKGTRSIKDLNLLCSMCNAMESFENKYKFKFKAKRTGNTYTFTCKI